MNTLAEPDPALSLTPWDVLDAVEACHTMIKDSCAGAPYSIARNQRYRELRRRVVTGLYAHPCFQEVRGPRSTHGDPELTHESALPTSLRGIAPRDPFL